VFVFFLVQSPADVDLTLADGSASFQGVNILTGFPSAFAASLDLAPIRTLLALCYVLTHIVCCVMLRWFPKAEMLPLSCFPMFKNSVDLFDPRCRKWHWLTEKPHATGTLKNYAFPMASRGCIVQSKELDRLPFKYVLIGHCGVDVDDRDKETVIMANVDMQSKEGEALKAAIDVFVTTSKRGRK